MKALVLALAAALAAGSFVPTPPTNGEELIRAMHDRYAGKWYKTLTFRQETTMEDGHVETWYEAARIPGSLRIDIMPMDSGNAMVFRNDSLLVYRGGARAQARAFVHPLMVLGFDVYAAPPESTIARLRGLRFDLSKLHEDTWQGKPVYVVGADAGDTVSSQFWVDRENLLFVRMLQTNPNTGARAETQFNKYQRLGGGWIAPEVVFIRNGKVATTEEYSEIRSDVMLPDSLWDRDGYARPAWVGTP